MDYYELRKEISKVVPRKTYLLDSELLRHSVRRPKMKGRKTDYREYKIMGGHWKKIRRELAAERINTFVEISCKAVACPMPFNVDVWDGLKCPYACRYCFAFSFRTSLYTAFFDNVASLGIRHCDPKYFKAGLDKLMLYRGKNPHDVGGAEAKAIALGIPIRFGIRFEDFIAQEAKAGVSLEMLKYLADQSYPVMVNTKSDLIGEDRYVDALSRNKGKAAVHMTLITSDKKVLKDLEPGAPSYQRRLQAMKNLVDGGVRVVVRIEPFLVFVADERDVTSQYMEDLWNIGVRNITFDTYSYSAKTPTIHLALRNVGVDLERLLLTGCDSQALGSLLLSEYMKLFRSKGFSCSTFDMGNVPDNDQDICCEVGDLFGDTGYNWGCSVIASRFIKKRKGKLTSWLDFKNWVDKKGGFLSEVLEMETHKLWNCEGADAYSPSWSRGLEAVDYDRYGLVWKFGLTDYRWDLYYGMF